ncbi:MAG TPA: hypothetical protein VEW42_00345 [Candidatus Eisenbacteria bacterium]|nr:hypothetical protein [Candidatus Eisenbacteria bacterium]
MPRKNNITHRSLLLTIFLWLVVPVLLFFIWFAGALFANPQGGFTTLIYPHSNKEYTHLPKDNILLKGTKVIGEFVSQEDNLGIVTIHVSRSLVAQPDEPLYLKFHIKEVGTQNWYYENIYNVGSLREDESIVFGFPKIGSSKGKIYEFELLSLNGDKTNAIAIINGHDSFVTRYIFSKKEISGKKLYMVMPYKKIVSVFMYPQVLLSTSIFILPLVYYILFMLLYTSRHIAFFLSQLSGKTLKGVGVGSKNTNFLLQNYLKRSFLGSFTITLITADIFLLQSIYYGIALGLLGFWIIAIVKDKISLKISLLFALLFLLLSELDIVLGNIAQENKTSMWAYFFLVIAVAQIIWRNRK